MSEFVDRNATVTMPEAESGPSPESKTPGARDSKGRFTAGNDEALVHGKYSMRLIDDAIVADEARKILRELGLPLGTIDLSLAMRYVQADALANSCGAQIQTLGATTPRGKKRAIVDVYLKTVETQMTLAERLGYKPGRGTASGDSLYGKTPAELLTLLDLIKTRLSELAASPAPALKHEKIVVRIPQPGDAPHE